MAYTSTGPSTADFFPAVIEEATVIDVNMRNYTCAVVTRHTQKRFNDLQWASPYFNNENGEGMNFVPEVGSRCNVFRGNDTTPPFLLGFIAIPNVTQTDDGTPARSTTEGGSTTDVSFRGRRWDMKPGDMFFTTRDENFILLRRGGIVQIGSTDIAQRMYIPVNNIIRDVCENYEMSHLGGDIQWTTARKENDPGGNAPISYIFHCNQYAQDAKASLRVRHFPPNGPSDSTAQVWEVQVAAQGIDAATGDVSNAAYTMIVKLDGSKTEYIGSSYSLRVKSTLTIEADDAVEIKSNNSTATLQAAQTAKVKGSQVVLDGSVLAGGEDAVEPGVLGNQLVTYLTTLAAAAGSAPPGPQILSTKVKLSP